MVMRFLSCGAIPALAGAALFAISATPSIAFTLAQPSLAPNVAAADIALAHGHHGAHHGRGRSHSGGRHHSHCWNYLVNTEACRRGI